MLNEVIQKAKIEFDTKNEDRDIPSLINQKQTAELLRKISGKMVAGEIPEFINLMVVGILEDFAATSASTNSKKITIKELMDLVSYRHSVYFNIGSVGITRINQKADMNVIKKMVRLEVRKMKSAMKEAKIPDDDIDTIMDKYGTLSDETDPGFFEDWDPDEEIKR